MIETDINISVNRKTDIERVKQILIQERIESPIFIVEYENNYNIGMTSDYEQWELDTKILTAFPGYEFISNVSNGRKEIRLEISRYQSEFCTTGWGTPIENALNETKYLVKISKKSTLRFSPAVEVLFGSDIKHYYVNIIRGENTVSGQQGFLLLDDFSEKNQNENAPILKDRLYLTPQDAFHRGISNIENIAKDDYIKYFEQKKKEKREVEKIPRKIIRDFVKGCNNNDNNMIFDNISKDINIEISTNWKIETILNGIEDFQNYLQSPTQEITHRNFKIHSKWYFNKSNVEINLECPVSANSNDTPNAIRSFSRMTFVLTDDKKISVMKWVK